MTVTSLTVVPSIVIVRGDVVGAPGRRRSRTMLANELLGDAVADEVVGSSAGLHRPRAVERPTAACAGDRALGDDRGLLDRGAGLGVALEEEVPAGERRAPTTTTRPRTSHFQRRRMRTLPGEFGQGYGQARRGDCDRSQAGLRVESASTPRLRGWYDRRFMRRTRLHLRHRHSVASAGPGVRAPTVHFGSRSRAVFRCRNELSRPTTRGHARDLPDRDHRRGRHRPRGRRRGR